MNEATKEMLIARGVMTENHYVELERIFPDVRPLDENQLQHMNRRMGFDRWAENGKGPDYRPYCVRRNCSRNPRMYRVEDGFKCWHCHGHWDLSEHRRMWLTIVTPEMQLRRQGVAIRGRQMGNRYGMSEAHAGWRLQQDPNG